jgi:hypothetical protein
MANNRRSAFFEGSTIFGLLTPNREFRNYKWKEDQAGKATNEPIDKFNHGIDAVRYVCLAKVMVNRKRMLRVGRV